MKKNKMLRFAANIPRGVFEQNARKSRELQCQNTIKSYFVHIAKRVAMNAVNSSKKIVAVLTAVSMFWLGASLVEAKQASDTIVFEEATPTVTPTPEKIYDLDTGTSKNAISVDGAILNNIYLGDMSLAGLTREEAMTFVENHLDEATSALIALRVESNTVNLSAKKLGIFVEYEAELEEAVKYGKTGNVFRRYKTQKQLEHEPYELPLTYEVDEETLRNALETYCTTFDREVVDFGLTRKNNTFEIMQGQTGISFKMDESVNTVLSYFNGDWTEKSGKIELAVDITQPKGSEEELSRVTDILGKGSTKYSTSNANRKKNIATGVEKLNGTLLYPGETLSVSGLLVPFTEENGYYSAASYANGEVVESLGGGVCQVSTTLYLAVIRSELQVVERHNHSMTVAYVKTAMDAAIAEGYKDLKIKNNLEAPIYIDASANGSTVYFAIYGEEYRPSNRKVTFENEVIKEIEPATELKADATLPFGTIKKTQSSHTGYNSQLWKIITIDGEETKELVNKSNYRTSPAKYSIGIDTANAEAASALRKAIATNDLEAVQEVIKTYENANHEQEDNEDNEGE